METVYFSLTQLLVRSAVLAGSHRFRTTVGSVADFEWSMNLCRVTGTVHIPEKLATWRSHGSQLSYEADPSRKQSLEVACEAYVKSPENGIRVYRGLALLLPAWRNNPSGHHLRVTAAAAALLSGLFLLVETILRPHTVLRSLVTARFGKYNLKESWISFLLNQWGIAPTTAFRNGTHTTVK